MKIKLFLLLLAITVFLFCCKQKKEEKIWNHNTPAINIAKGYVVPKANTTPPEVIPAGKPKTATAGKPKIIPAPNNVSVAGIPKIIPLAPPQVCIPGKDSFLLPKPILAVDSPLLAGIPESVIAKDAHVADNNPFGFSSFSKLQGLRHQSIPCLLQDRAGNIWLGTNGAGVCRYDGKYFTFFTEKEGLCNNNINAILQDHKGNIWFGSRKGGICKYDGKYFTQYDTKQGFINNTILCIAQDKQGNIWFGTGAGACKYDGKYFTWFTTKEGLASNVVSGITEDQEGNIWMSCYGARFSKYDGVRFINYKIDGSLTELLITCITVDAKHNIWLGTNCNGAYQFDGKLLKQYTQKEGLLANMVMDILENKNGTIWLATDVGISAFDGTNFTNYGEIEGVNNIVPNCLLKDKNGIMWVGSELGGVLKFVENSFTHYTIKQGLSSNSVSGITEDHNGNLWFSTYNNGINKYNIYCKSENNKAFTQFTQKDGLFLKGAMSMIRTQNDTFWLSTAFEGLARFNIAKQAVFNNLSKNEGLNIDGLFCLANDSMGNIWCGSDGTGVAKYDGQSFTYYTVNEGLSHNTVYAIINDKVGDIWLATGKGATKYNPKTGESKFTQFTLNEGLTNNAIICLYQDKNNDIWFGSYGEGIFRYNGKTFTNFTEKDGLNSNFVSSILQDKDGNMWFGTRFGLSKLTPKALAKLEAYNNNATPTDEKPILFKNYGYEDGFLGIGCNRNAIYQDSKGTIWVGTNDRLTKFQPIGDDIDTIAPNIQLTGLELFNEAIQWQSCHHKKDTTFLLGNGVRVGHFSYDSLSRWYNVPQNLSLKYNNNYITFSYIGIATNAPKKVKYRYKLEGIDYNWSALTDRTEAAYGNLPPGTYTFYVKAMNGDGYWSAPINYTFTITPPWWLTWWAYIGYVLLAFSGLFIFIKWRLDALISYQKQLELTVKTRTAELVAEKKEIEKQKEEIQHKNKEITDNINYAQRIQAAILPDIQLIYKILAQSFILYQPKDIVSGDFYGFVEKNGTVIIIAADCTGHGVSGAFMSMIGSSLLNQIINEKNIVEPALILNQLNTSVIEALNQTTNDTNDGMDIAIASINLQANQMQFAGANRPLWLIKKNELLIYAPTKYPIGGLQVAQDRTFTNQTIALQKNDTVYIFTDGFADQFGGEKGKKMMTAKLKEKLLSIQNLTMPQQQIALKTYFDQWKGTNEQVDDVLVIGVRL